MNQTYLNLMRSREILYFIGNILHVSLRGETLLKP